ncbi:sigma-70 family RNA polymerase sigma factor [Sphingomonas sp.]|uniref:sigma-70 family RNA polymerase sigma factor n=1 Tax=Sphingomonas sp. TaxID=28214 RepID=UPI0025E00664|nr:sigma-70 family RNA polymerase sigma factor [Sphingomonas sp.]
MERSRGLRIITRPERVEALLWATLRFDNRQEAREPLFHLYRPYARSIATRHWRPTTDCSLTSDAEQWAYEGLLQAIDSFDPLRGAPFRGFARRRILGSIRDGFSRNSELDAQHSTRRRLERERLQSLKEQAEDGKDAIERIAEIAVGLAVGLMLSETRLIAGDDDPDPGASAYDTLVWRQTQQLLARAVEFLPEREAMVIVNHYEHGLSFTQIADLIGVSRGRVSQLHHSALGKLRKKISKENLT